MKPNRRRNVILVCVALVALLAIGVFSAARSKPKALAVKIVSVSYGAFQTRLPETGTVQRPQTQTLAAEVTGNIGHIFVKPGDRVVAGQLLVTIDNPQLASSALSGRDAAAAAAGRARTAGETNRVLPAQTRSAVVQAQAAVVQARVALQQAEQDVASGAQSGLGYGGVTAQEQRLAADANAARTQTDLREAQRIADANRDLFENKAISRDALDQSLARLAQTRVAADQARQQRLILGTTLGRNQVVLRNRVGAQRDALRQAEANLNAARANASASKAGDVAAAEADAARAADDARYAQEQLGRTKLRAPFAGVVQNVATQTGDALRPLQPGDAVVLGSPLVTLAVDRSFIVRTKVDEQDIPSVAVGQRAIVTGEAFGGKTLSGHVAAVAPLAQKSDDPTNTARQIMTTVALDSTLPFLRDGMTVDVDIVTVDLRRALTIPSDGVRRDTDKKPYAYVVRKGRTARVALALGASNDANSVVRSGLAPGDQVVVDKNPAIAADALVTAQPSSSPAPKP